MALGPASLPGLVCQNAALQVTCAAIGSLSDLQIEPALDAVLLNTHRALGQGTAAWAGRASAPILALQAAALPECGNHHDCTEDQKTVSNY